MLFGGNVSVPPNAMRLLNTLEEPRGNGFNPRTVADLVENLGVEPSTVLSAAVNGFVRGRFTGPDAKIREAVAARGGLAAALRGEFGIPASQVIVTARPAARGLIDYPPNRLLLALGNGRVTRTIGMLLTNLNMQDAYTNALPLLDQGLVEATLLRDVQTGAGSHYRRGESMGSGEVVLLVKALGRGVLTDVKVWTTARGRAHLPV